MQFLGARYMHMRNNSLVHQVQILGPVPFLKCRKPIKLQDDYIIILE